MVPGLGEMCRFLTSIWGRLFSIGLDLHSSGDLGVGFSSRQISDVDEGVVEGGQQVDDSEGVLLGLSNSLRRSVVVDFLFLDDLLLGGLQERVRRWCVYLPF